MYKKNTNLVRGKENYKRQSENTQQTAAQHVKGNVGALQRPPQMAVKKVQESLIN